MNDARRQILHESFKLIDLSIMIVAFFLAAWVTASDKTALLGAFLDPPEAAPAIVAPVEEAPVVVEEELAEAEELGWLRYLVPMEQWLEALGSLLRVKLILLLMVMLFAWNATFTSRGLYNSRRLDSRLAESLDVLRASALGSLVVLVLANAVYQELAKGNEGLALYLGEFEKAQWQFLSVFFIIASGATIVTRLVIRHLLEAARLRGRNLRAVLIVGTNHRALRFANAIKAKPQMGYYVAGFVDEEWDGIAGFKKGGHKLVASLKGLGEYLADSPIDEVVVALPVSSAYIYSSRIVSLCQGQGITVRFISQIFDSRLAKGRLEVFDGEPMLSLETSPDEGFSRLLKKIIDGVVSAVLLGLLAPLFAAVAVAIKIWDPGPVFFVQTRVGHNKRRFKLYKFRTMVVDAEARLKELEHLNQVSGPVFKIEKDPRVTPLGEFLRKTSIDELPQLWNVLKGDMSLVGPRPLPERDYRGFDTDAHRRRLSVRPGLTCTWQVSGRNSIPFERWMEMDLEYIDSWSLWKDFGLLLRTIPVVLGPLLFFRRGEFVKGAQEEKPKTAAAAKPVQSAQPTQPAKPATSESAGS